MISGRGPAPSVPARDRHQHDQAAREAFKRLQHEARQRSVIVYRTDARDGAVQFFTERGCGDLRHHASEAQLRRYLRELP